MAEFDDQILGDDPLLAEMVHRLVDVLQPEGIYLFGSRARGGESEGSDYDLLVIVSESSLPRYRREQAALRALYGIEASKEVIVLTRAEFESKRLVVCSLEATVAREGRPPYAA